jgi:uncharacterized protein DUF4375
MSDAGELYWSLVEPFWEKVDIYRGPERFLRSFSRAPTEAGLLLAAHWCRSEVSNGGLHQFFTNPTGVLAPEALEGLTVLRLGRAARVLRDAMAFFGRRYPRVQAVRARKLARLQGDDEAESDPFARLDDKFFSATEGFDDAADRYAAKCKAQANRPLQRTAKLPPSGRSPVRR